MATYTSTQSGPWNDPATWGGGGFPQVTGDVFNIGHQVTMNLNLDPASVALGQGTLNNGGILTFARDRNTLPALRSPGLGYQQRRLAQDGRIGPNHPQNLHRRNLLEHHRR